MKSTKWACIIPPACVLRGPASLLIVYRILISPSPAYSALGLGFEFSGAASFCGAVRRRFPSFPRWLVPRLRQGKEKALLSPGLVSWESTRSALAASGLAVLASHTLSSDLPHHLHGFLVTDVPRTELSQGGLLMGDPGSDLIRYCCRCIPEDRRNSSSVCAFAPPADQALFPLVRFSLDRRLALQVPADGFHQRDDPVCCSFRACGCFPVVLARGLLQGVIQRPGLAFPRGPVDDVGHLRQRGQYVPGP